MRILVLNCGSSSAKYQLFDYEEVAAKGLVERIGESVSLFTHYSETFQTKKSPIDAPDHTKAIDKILEALNAKEKKIDAVGHRVVHGGEKFSSSVLIDSEVMKRVQDCIPLAPLHNPSNIKGIEACSALLPGVPQVAVFDTAFHQTLPDYAYIYGIPYSYYKKYRVRRYGFHGTSHYYVSNRAARLLNRPIEELKIVTCHLGNGCSIAAVKYGKSVDTSMGFTPLEGLLMGTRSGDFDPAVVLFLMEKENLDTVGANSVFNKRSGLLGISQTANDMREILRESKEGNELATLAFEVFTYRLKKYIASYSGVMGGVDAVVFTGGIGENAKEVRESSLSELEFMGVEFDRRKNDELSAGEHIISKEDSKVVVLVIPTNEELVIAKETERICSS